jgi:hypothetical protein
MARDWNGEYNQDGSTVAWLKCHMLDILNFEKKTCTMVEMDN